MSCDAIPRHNAAISFHSFPPNWQWHGSRHFLQHNLSLGALTAGFGMESSSGASCSTDALGL